MSQVSSVTKSAYSVDTYSKETYLELAKCTQDPIYFIENYIRIQHPKKGSVPLKLFDFQKELVMAYHNHENVICLLSRQMGKSITNQTLISKNKKNVKICSIIDMTFTKRIIDKLEKLKLYFSKYL